MLHVSLSGGLSGTVNAARNARQHPRRALPGPEDLRGDSLGASSGYGLLMDKAADLRDDGMSIEALQDWLEAHQAGRCITGYSLHRPDLLHQGAAACPRRRLHRHHSGHLSL